MLYLKSFLCKIGTCSKICRPTSSMALLFGSMSNSAVANPSSIPFTLLSALAIAISYADRSNISTAIIPMAEVFHWDSLFSGLVLSSFWIGYGLTQVIGGEVSDRFGGEKVLIFALVLWSFCTALTPFAASLGNGPLIIARVILGAGEGFALPAIHSMVTKYVDKSQRSLSVSIVTGACYLGAVISNLIAPTIIQQFSWQYCFWLFAIIPPLIWLPSWVRFISTAEPLDDIVSNESPISLNEYFNDSGHSNNSHDNLLIAEENTVQVTDIMSTKTAAKASVTRFQDLLKFRPVWAIILVQYASSWGMVGLLSWLPTYFSQKFDIPLESLGKFTVLPYVCQLAVAVASGFLADTLMGPKFGMRILTVRNILQITGMLVPAVCLAGCAVIPSLTVGQASGLLTLGSAMSALTVAGVSCSQFDISPKNAGTIFGLGNTASCIGGAVAVPVSGWLFDVSHSWDTVFLVFAAHYIGGALLWLLLASDKPLDLNEGIELEQF